MVLLDLAVIHNMDPEPSLPITNQYDNPTQEHNGLAGIQSVLRSKWMLMLGGGLLLTVLLVVVFSPRNSQQTAPDTKLSGTSLTSDVPTDVPTPTMTVEYKQAVQEAQQSATEYDAGRAQVREEFPWIRKFPISGEGKYFVYFDKEKKVFVGKLYPRTGDNTEQLKSKAIQHMQQREIPTDSYPFEWLVTAQ